MNQRETPAVGGCCFLWVLQGELFGLHLPCSTLWLLEMRPTTLEGCMCPHSLLPQKGLVHLMYVGSVAGRPGVRISALSLRSKLFYIPPQPLELEFLI